MKTLYKWLLVGTSLMLVGLASNRVAVSQEKANETKIQESNGDDEEELRKVLEGGLSSAAGHPVKLDRKNFAKISNETPALEFVKATDATFIPAALALPLRSWVYGSFVDTGASQALKRHLFMPQLVVCSRVGTEIEGVGYQFKSPQENDRRFIYDPILLNDGRTVVFKFGFPDDMYNEFGLYSFDTITKRVSRISSEYLSGPVAISPEGGFVSYFTHDKTILNAQDLNTHVALEVAKGKTLQFISWCTKKRIVYSINKTHHIANHAVNLPVTYSYDLTTKKYSAILDKASWAVISPDGRFGIYKTKKAKNGVDTSKPFVGICDLLTREASNVQNVSYQEFAMSTGRIWGEGSKVLVWTLSAFDEKSDKILDTGSAFDGPLTMKHTIYSLNTDTKSVTEIAHFETKSVWDSIDVQNLWLEDKGKSVLCAVKDSRRNSLFTDLDERDYSFKLYDAANKHWKDLGALDGATGFSGLTTGGDRTPQLYY